MEGIHVDECAFVDVALGVLFFTRGLMYLLVFYMNLRGDRIDRCPKMERKQAIFSG